MLGDVVGDDAALEGFDEGLDLRFVLVAVTHCDYAFPSGDAFLVYPGPGGEPLTSLRAEVQSEGLTDLRALQTLEAQAGREAVERLVLENAGMESMSYTQYPASASYLLALREAVFDVLEKV